jgi:hypothetical protein
MSRPPKDREPQSRLQVAALPSDAARLIAQRTFLRLVQFVDGRKDVRLQRPETLLQALMMIWTCCDDPRQSYCCPSVDATASDSDAATQVDLSHEALILGWPSLCDWINERRAAELTVVT